jgi:hypothetical protein
MWWSGLFGAAIMGALLAFPQGAGRGDCRAGAAGHHRPTDCTPPCKTSGEREAAIITFLVTLSGVVIAGVGSAFWGCWLASAPCWFSMAAAAPRCVSEPRPVMHLLFVADPLESFKIYKDTTFAMMREAQRRGAQPERLRATPSWSGSAAAR